MHVYHLGLLGKPLVKWRHPEPSRNSFTAPGGYTDRKQGPVRHDRQIITDTLASSTTPLFGCAVSRSLQDALDPLGLKY